MSSRRQADLACDPGRHYNGDNHHRATSRIRPVSPAFTAVSS